MSIPDIRFLLINILMMLVKAGRISEAQRSVIQHVWPVVLTNCVCRAILKVLIGDCLMNVIFSSILMTGLVVVSPAVVWAQNLNPGNSGGANAPIATPTYGSDMASNPALTTGSRYSTGANVPAYGNPTVPGATGEGVVIGDRSTISGDRRATIQQKTGGGATDAQ
jgi:hypothetical protein